MQRQDEPIIGETQVLFGRIPLASIVQKLISSTSVPFDKLNKVGRVGLFVGVARTE